MRFHHVDEPDERDVLAAQAALTEADLADLDRRLDRLDRASSHGPWTQATLRLIAERPAVRAGDLAELAGRELQPFKLDVRKLKNLGLTISLDVGYRLSPRGPGLPAPPRLTAGAFLEPPDRFSAANVAPGAQHAAKDHIAAKNPERSRPRHRERSTPLPPRATPGAAATVEADALRGFGR